MDNFYDDDLIKRYLDGLLDIKQSKAIDKKIKEDPHYAQEIDLQRSIIKGLKKNETSKLVKASKNIHAQLEQEGFFDNIHAEIKEKLTKEETKVVPLFARFKWLAAAAAILLAIFFVLPTDDRPPLFANNFEQYPDQLSEIITFELHQRLTAEETKQAALKLQLDGLDAYNKQAYAEAIPLFETCLQDYPDYDKDGEIKFYLSIAYLANKEAKKAVLILEKLVQEEAQIPLADRHWYLALAYLYDEQNEKAKALLPLLKPHNVYGKKATAILEQL